LGVFGGAIFPTAFSKRSQASGSTSTVIASLIRRRFGFGADGLASFALPGDGMPTPQFSNVRLPDELLRAIGHVAALWAQLEYTIDSTIRQALDHPAAPEIDTALILPFRKRLELMQYLFEQLPDCAEQHKWAVEVAQEALRLKHLRDLIAHGAVAGSEHQKDGRIRYAFRRIRWEKPARLLEVKNLDHTEVDAIATQISNLIPVAMLLETAFWRRSST